MCVPKMSVVTISFNQARFIEKTILSVLSQDYSNFEYIIVDAGSTDGSREIITKYVSSINRIIFEADDGPADGLNKGFSLATGDIFYYLNADDIVLPGAFRSAAKIFQDNTRIQVVYGHGLMIDERDRLLRRMYSEKWRAKSLLCGLHVIQPSTFLRRQAFESVGGFNRHNRASWDYEMIVDIALAGGSFHRASQCWSAFRLYPQSITGSNRLKDGLRQDFNRVTEKIRSQIGIDRTGRSCMLTRLMVVLSDPYVSARRFAEAILYRVRVLYYSVCKMKLF